MMGPIIYSEAICYICGERRKGKFHDVRTPCDFHSNSERDFFSALPDDDKLLTKFQKQQKRLFMIQWPKPYIQIHSRGNDL